MARNRIRLDPRGPSEILKGELMQRAIKVKAEQVASRVRSQGITVGNFRGAGEIPLPVKVESEVTDRAKSRVIIAHAAGQAVQAKHGPLTKAAAQSGLDVHNARREGK